MHFKSFLFFILILILLPFSPSSAQVVAEEPNPVGTVMEVEGSVKLLSGGQEKSAYVGAPVYLNDIVATSDVSRALVLLIDDTEITLSDNTQLRIDTYVFEGDEAPGNKGIYSILKGSFIYISGMIANKINPDVTVNTPAGSIGIRGTEFWGGDIDGEYGVLVQQGAVRFKTDGGEVMLDKGQASSVKDRHFVPPAGQPWAAEKITRAVKTVTLQRMALVRQRIAQNRGRQEMLRTRHQKMIKAKLEQERKLLEDQGRPAPKILEQKRNDGSFLKDKIKNRSAPAIRQKQR